MIVLFKKIINSIFPSNSHTVEIQKRQKSNQQLRKKSESDIERWSKNDELFLDWNQRTLILGSFILPNARILEFGAGNMILKDNLQDYKSYTPSDIVARFDETIVCDLNKTIPFDLSIYNTVVLSGVLEYVYDIDTVFNQFGHNIQQVVLSYCCSDLVKLSRDKNGWLSDYEKKDLEEIFARHNFKIENYTEWRQQSLYNLIRL